MKSRVKWVFVGALATLLVVTVSGVSARQNTQVSRPQRVPNGSVGLKQLTPKLRKFIIASATQGGIGPAGPAGSPGQPGSPGLSGADGHNAAGVVFTYSRIGGGAHQPVSLTGEDGTSQDAIGPLALFTSCESEGEDTIRGKLVVESTEDGTFLNGEPVNAGTSKIFQNVVVSGGGSEETFPSVLRVTNEDGSFALQAVVSTLVGLPGGCHFFGTLIEDR